MPGRPEPGPEAEGPFPGADRPDSKSASLDGFLVYLTPVGRLDWWGTKPRATASHSDKERIVSFTYLDKPDQQEGIVRRIAPMVPALLLLVWALSRALA